MLELPEFFQPESIKTVADARIERRPPGDSIFEP
jgi:hypothetical protein